MVDDAAVLHVRGEQAQGHAADLRPGHLCALAEQAFGGRPPPKQFPQYGSGSRARSTTVESRDAPTAPATRHGLWVHIALMAPFVTLTGLWAFPYRVEDQQLGRGTAAALRAGAVLAFGLSAPVRGTLAGRRPHRRGTTHRNARHRDRSGRS